ncbi:MAG: recombination mediator RecR [Ectothiorhodospiraceae bacterium]
MAYSPLIEQLIEGLRTLPGVGPKSAQRMAFHILLRDRRGGAALAQAMGAAVERVGECRDCRLPTEDERCPICSSDQRDAGVLCLVESPADVFALEQATDFHGRYFVLGGRLSPLDGIDAADLGLDSLEERLRAGEVREIILATSPTVEGEATAQYVSEIARSNGASCTRIAHGVPMGGELETVDSGTLSQAFAGRRGYS